MHVFPHDQRTLSTFRAVRARQRPEQLFQGAPTRSLLSQLRRRRHGWRRWRRDRLHQRQRASPSGGLGGRKVGKVSLLSFILFSASPSRHSHRHRVRWPSFDIIQRPLLTFLLTALSSSLWRHRRCTFFATSYRQSTEVDEQIVGYFVLTAKPPKLNPVISSADRSEEAFVRECVTLALFFSCRRTLPTHSYLKQVRIPRLELLASCSAFFRTENRRGQGQAGTRRSPLILAALL